ncbi:PAS domain-containing sensor histidine kinase [Actinomadura sp. B10D3]|uniref:sensor histidine kinase n=1 Tax=Actinomadura sp. B10D3 TaxID=3153557 RepID=UPI00325E7EEE
MLGWSKLTYSSSTRITAQFIQSPSVIASMVAFLVPLGFCLLQPWTVVSIGTGAVLLSGVLPQGPGWRAVILDAAKAAVALSLAALAVTAARLPTLMLDSRQVVALTVAAMLMEGAMSWSARVVLIADGLIRVGCAVGFAILILMADRTGQLLWGGLALIPAVIHYLNLRVLYVHEKALRTAERLLQLHPLMAEWRMAPERMEPFLHCLRQVMGSDLLVLHTVLPAGQVWVESSSSDTRLHDARPRHLSGFEPSDFSEAPGIVPRHDLPDGWRAGVLVPLRAPDGRDAGYMLLGWTRRSGPYLAAWMVTGVLGGAVASTAHAMGAIWTDVWATDELERERARLSAVIDHSDIAILAMEPSGRVEIWNAAMAELVGTAADEAVGMRAVDLFTLTDEKGETVDLADAPYGTVELKTKSGRSLWVEMSCSKSASFSGALITAAFVDRSARRNLEYMRQLILLSVHHELCGGLTMIGGHAQFLGDGVTDEGTAGSVAAIVESVQMMERAIADLVRVVSPDSPSVQPVTETEDLDLVCLLRKTLTSLPSVAKRTLVSAPEEMGVSCDPVRLRQCLHLVLVNAEKYAPAGKVTIEVRREAGYAVVTIADEGPGIPADELDLVLKPYYRSASTQALPGAGLGLHIAKTMMCAMQGHIELTSAPSGGLQVDLRLPLATTERESFRRP